MNHVEKAPKKPKATLRKMFDKFIRSLRAQGTMMSYVYLHFITYSPLWAYSAHYMPIKSTKFLKFSKTHYMPIKEDFNTKTSTKPQISACGAPETDIFWRLTIYSYFAIIETLSFITLRRYCSSGRCFQVRICQFRSHYMPMKKIKFSKKIRNTLYAHNTICP